MTDLDSELDLKLEKQEEMARDIAIENRMRNDLQFCLEQLEIEDKISELEELVNELSNYGHEITLKEIINER